MNIKPQLFMFIVFTFVSGTIISLIIEGSYWGTGDEWDVMQSITGYSTMQISGAGGITIPQWTWGFLSNGLPKMLLWNYSFLDGSWAVIKPFLFAISAGIVFGVGMLIMNIAQGVLGLIR